MKRYEEPKIEVLALEVEDVVTTSDFQRDADEGAEHVFH